MVWSVCCDDRSSGKHAHLDCGGCDRHAAWLHWAERTGADGAGAGAALRSRLCFPWPSRRSHQASVVRRRRAVLVSQAAGTRTLHLAEGREWLGLVDTCAVVDAAGRHRLATPSSNRRITDGDLTTRVRYVQLFMRLWTHTSRVRGILRL